MERRTFKKFLSLGEAQSIAQELKNYNIEASIELDHEPLNITFSGTGQADEYRILLDQSDFQKANRIIEDIFDLELEEMPSDYYLNDFSTEELLEVVEKKDEWSETDYGWAKKILIQKKILTEEKLEALHQNRLFDLAKQKRVKTGWLVLLYVFGIFGWIAGIFTGAISAVSTWVIIAQSKTLPSGKQLFIYDKYSRNHAYVLLAINIIAIIIVFFIGPFNLFNAFF